MFKFKFKPAKTSDKEVIWRSICAAFVEAVYVLFVVVFFSIGTAVFPQTGNPIIPMIAFLLLFVLSAGISGVLILGYPIFYVLQGKYREAILSLTGTMVTILVIFTVLLIGAAL